MANGDVSVPLGTVTLPIKFNGTTVHHSITVADVEAPAIIGYDFMFSHSCMIDLTNSKFHIGEHTLPYKLQSQLVASVFRITIESTVAIPPGAEMIVGAQVQARPEELAYMK